MIDFKVHRATAVVAALFLVFWAADLHARTGAPGFRAIAFYTGKSDKAHISFAKETSGWRNMPRGTALWALEKNHARSAGRR